MKKLFAFIAMMGILTFGFNQTVIAQDEVAPAATEEVAQNDSAAVDSVAAQDSVAEEDNAVVEEETTGLHKNIKIKFIEGGA